MKDRYLTVLRYRIHAAFNDLNTPPITLARIEYKIFAENIDELKVTMADEFPLLMGEWFDAAAEIGVKTELDQMIAKLINDFASHLLLSGVNMMTTEYGEALIAADAAWRRKNQALAVRYPKD